MRPTSATGTENRDSPGFRSGRKPGLSRFSAFTLVELLVVVAITGIVLAVAAVNLWPSDAEVARREAGLLALSLERTRDAAWFGGLPTAATFEKGRLRQWRFVPGDGWKEDVARARNLGDVAITGLAIEGVPLTSEQRLIFLADGFAQPFRLSLEVRGISRVIEGDAAGSLTLSDK